MQIRWLLPIFIIAGLFTGCSQYSSTEDKRNSVSNTETTYPNPDPEISALLESYRDSLDAVMGQKIATVHDTLRFSKPESPLGNLVADALRYRAGSELKEFVHMGIIGDSSFGLYLTPGELTLHEVMEFMPYENHLVILKMHGSKVFELANQIAEMGGAPVSGIRFRIEDGEARGVLVNSQILDHSTEYMVATSSWAANGGDRFPALWDYNDRIDLYDVNVRDLYTDYFKSRQDIYPNLDGRIRF